MQTAVFSLLGETPTTRNRSALCFFYLASCHARTTFAVETIIQVVCFANGRLFPAPEGLPPHATAPLFAFLFGKLPCTHDFCQIKKQPESSFQVACGGDNKTRTYDLYDVNVAL